MTREARPVSTTRVRRTAAAVALAALVLTGCASNRAGAASIVGGERISDSDIASVVDEIRTQGAAVPQTTFDEKATTLATLTRETRHLLFEQAAAHEGLTVTQGQVDTVISQQITTSYGGDRAKFEAAGVQAGIPASEISQYFRDVLLVQALGSKVAPGADSTTGQAKLNAYLATFGQQVGVEVAPRFGQWSYPTVSIVAGPNDLSTVPPSSSFGTPTPSTSTPSDSTPSPSAS